MPSRNSPYASVEDYKRRFGDFDEHEWLEEVLMDATTLIATELERAGLDPDDPDAADARMRVCRSMVNRAIGEDADGAIPTGVTQMTQTAGIFSRQYTFGNAYKDLFLTKQERRMLGIYGSRIGYCALGMDAGDLDA